MSDEQPKTRQEEIEEKKKWALKYFDYAEDPIKEWIAAQLEETVDILFDDYKQMSDIISTEIDKVYYTLYLTPFPSELRNGTAFNLSKEQFRTMPKLQKAASKMFEAVYTVFPPVIKTMTNMTHRLEDVFPEFDEDLMCFRFRMVNKYEIIKNQAIQMLDKIRDQFERIKDKEGEEFEKISEQLKSLQIEQINKLNGISASDCSAQEEKCGLANESFNKGARLYMVLDVNVKPDDDVIMKRLPDFGLKYQDPDEENYIDRYKREQQIE